MFVITVPIIIDTKLQATDCQWNHDGTVLAVCGMKTFGSDKDSNVVMFYSPFGVVNNIVVVVVVLQFFESSRCIILIFELWGVFV